VAKLEIVSIEVKQTLLRAVVSQSLDDVNVDSYASAQEPVQLHRVPRGMTPTSFRRAIVIVAGAFCVACGDPLRPVATQPNVLDALTLDAFNGPNSLVASALNLYDAAPVRPDVRFDFDLVFDATDDGKAIVYPVRQLSGLAGGHQVGMQIVPGPFDDVREAPRFNYAYDSTFVVAPGTILAVESAKAGICTIYSVSPYFYAKVMVVSVDVATRRIGLAFAVDRNCGFRGLGPGLPSF
jgi:hypothetical protein